MHRVIAQRLTEQHKEGFTSQDGDTYNAARVYDGMLQVSENGGASWISVDWRAVRFTCKRTGRRIRFRREIAEARAMRIAEYYIVLAIVALIGSVAGMLLTW